MSICGDASALIIVGFSLIVFSFLLQLIGVVTPYWIYKMVDDVEYFSGLWQHCGTNALSTTCTEVRCGKYNFVCLFVCFMVFNATFNSYFSYIVAVSFIGGGNRSTRRKPPTCCKSLTNFIT